ncbi:radical SAM protein [Oscillospiraceae bacterium 50-16]
MIDVDGHNFPNIALMKLSSWHKSRGDIVEWWWSDMVHYDVVYMSKVFSFTPDHPEPLNADRIIKGGTGYAIAMENGKEIYRSELDIPLVEEVEHIYPDYDMYPRFSDTAYGFLSRGCPRGCGFCHVAGKEGRSSRKVADLSEFWTGQKSIEVMDPNILACQERDDLLDQLRLSGATVNFNQGLDIRLMDRDVAELLGKMRIKRLHFAWDNPSDDLRAHFERFSEQYRRKDPAGKMVYVLTNFNSTIDEDLYRINTLRSLRYDPYVMVYNRESAPPIIRHLQRWCNNKFIFKAEPDFWKYNPRRS